MRNYLLARKWRRRTVSAVLYTCGLLSVFACPMLSIGQQWLALLSASLCLFLVLSLSAAYSREKVIKPPPAAPRVDDGLPAIPRTLQEMMVMLDDKSFELFSAALVIALGEGHRFYRHSGGSGDQGVDTRLHNQFGLIVAVQSKFYTSSIGSPFLRDFGFSLEMHNAAYGFFVTTADFTPDARAVISKANGRIRTLNGQQIEALLQYRNREVALAYRDVLELAGK